MPGKQARVLCPVCQEPIPPDETECQNCGAFVIDEAVVRLSRAFGLDREHAMRLFEAGFRHPKQLRDRDPHRVLEKGEVGLLFICTNCGGFVAGGDSKCPRCAAEFETEVEEPAKEEEDILDLVLCPGCGADNDPDLAECEICGEALREPPAPKPVFESPSAPVAPTPKLPAGARTLERVDDLLREDERSLAPPVRAAESRESRVSVPPTIPKPSPDAAVATAPGPVPRVARVITSKPMANPKTSERGPIGDRAPLGMREPIPVRAGQPADQTEMGTEAALAKLAKIRERARATRTTASRTKRREHRPHRSVPRRTTDLPPETVGGLVLAAAAGLILAVALGQHWVSAGIAALLVGLCIHESLGFVRGPRPRMGLVETLLLAGGISAGIGVVLLRNDSIVIAALLACAAVAAFGEVTRRTLRSPQRVLLAVGSALPIVGQAIVAAVDPAYRLTILSILGALVAVPWPAALAVAEIRRRQSSTVLRRQVVAAEQNIQRKDYERSLTEYNRAIARVASDVPGAEIPWYGKGATLILLGRYEEALRAIDTALDINPRSEVAWVNKGNALTRLGRLIDALRCFNAAIKVNPRFEVAWNNKGNALARMGKFEEALPCYEHALELDPGYRGAWVNKGYVLTKLGRFDEAASCADQALRLDRGGRAEPA